MFDISNSNNILYLLYFCNVLGIVYFIYFDGFYFYKRFGMILILGNINLIKRDKIMNIMLNYIIRIIEMDDLRLFNLVIRLFY